MRLRHLVCTGVAVLMAVVLTPAVASAATSAGQGAAVAGAPQPTLNPRLVTTFPRGADGTFAESLAIDNQGTLYVSLTTWQASGWNRGQIWRVATDGSRTRFGPSFDVGVLTGLAFDGRGRLYAGVAAWTDPVLPALRSGVLRIDATGVTRVLTLPTAAQNASSFPNGLAFHGRDLYVSDSTTGAVWRTRPYGTIDDVQTTPWLRSSLLAPSTSGALGVNGIAFRASSLYAVVSDSGRLVRIGVGRHGQPLTPQVVTRSAALVDADGVAFDILGRLWVTTNGGGVPHSGALVRVDARGRVTVLVDRPAWMDYPTQPAFGTGRSDRTTLYITNGAFSSTGSSTVMAIQVASHGVRLPQ